MENTVYYDAKNVKHCFFCERVLTDLRCKSCNAPLCADHIEKHLQFMHGLTFIYDECCKCDICGKKYQCSWSLTCPKVQLCKDHQHIGKMKLDFQDSKQVTTTYIKCIVCEEYAVLDKHDKATYHLSGHFWFECTACGKTFDDQGGYN